MLKIRFCQRRLVRRQRMVSCPAATKQNDGDKRRKNGPGKISTLSVGQGETPGNLLTVIHKARKPCFKMFLLGAYDCASKSGADNGDKSKLNFLAIRHSCFATYLSRVIAREFHRLGRPGCPSNVIRYPAALFCGFAFVFRQSEICVICGLYGFRIRKAGRSNSRRN